MSDTALQRAVVPLRSPLDLKKRLRKVAPLAALLLAGIAAAGYGYHWWTVGRFIESTDDAYVGGEVTVIAPKVPGLIAQVLVADNQTVRGDDVLVRIDDRDYRAALDKARGAVAAQRAGLANLDANRGLQEAVVAEAEAEQQAAEAELTRAQLDIERYRRLVTDQVASTQRYQQAEADAKKAEAAVARARAALAAARQQIAVIDTQKGQTQAALTQALADEETAQLNLGYTELRAPIDGVVGNRSARTGAYATTGGQLLSIVPTHGLWVDANFKESQLAHMRPGMTATISADVAPDETIRGHVVSLAPATGAQFSILPPENATGNFTKIVQRVPVRIALDGDAETLGRLRPGLSVTASVDERPAR